MTITWMNILAGRFHVFPPVVRVPPREGDRVTRNTTITTTQIRGEDHTKSITRTTTSDPPAVVLCSQLIWKKDTMTCHPVKRRLKKRTNRAAASQTVAKTCKLKAVLFDTDENRKRKRATSKPKYT